MKKIIYLLSFFVSLQLVSQTDHANTQVLIKTSYGDIVVVLYNDTPMHRDNFIELVESEWYNSSTFHRVMKNFMIQGGGNADGRPDPGYTIPSEFRPNHIHEKGTLSAARKPDNVNPEKASSGSQFYIVQGQVFNDSQINSMAAKSGFTYTDTQHNIYKTIGGTPWLDGGYTVFGKVVSGIDVVDKIAAVQTGQANKPVKDVTMSMEIIK